MKHHKNHKHPDPQERTHTHNRATFDDPGAGWRAGGGVLRAAPARGGMGRDPCSI